MRRSRLVIAGAVLGLLLVLGGSLLFWFWPVGKTKAETPAAPVPVHTVLPHQGGLERTVTRPASIHAFQYANLYAMVAGYLRNQVVDIGTTVTKNQVLAEIDEPQLATDVLSAAAALQKAKAKVQVMQARVRVAVADVQEAKVKVEQVQADVLNAVAMLKLRKQQYQRIKRLVEAKSVEQELADEKFEAQQAAVSTERAQRKAVETATVAVTTALARQTAAEANLADARAQVNVAQAALDRAKIFESFTKIRAPFNGVVTLRGYHDGDYIHKGGQADNGPILTVARTDLMRVLVDLPDPDVPYTHRGEKAELRIASLPGRVFTGTVARTARSEAYSTRTMRTEIDLPNPKGVLTEGMFGSVTIYLGADPDALTIPSACLVGPELNGERAVYVVRDGRARLVKVRVRRDDGINAELDPGLNPQEPLVLSHGPGLHDGAAVAVQTTTDR